MFRLHYMLQFDNRQTTTWRALIKKTLKLTLPFSSSQLITRTTMNDLAENRAANANNERLWNPTDLFHLTTGQRDYESILAPLREFLKNYDIT